MKLNVDQLPRKVWVRYLRVVHPNLNNDILYGVRYGVTCIL
jgi:hypothetical protein